MELSRHIIATILDRGHLKEGNPEKKFPKDSGPYGIKVICPGGCGSLLTSLGF